MDSDSHSQLHRNSRDSTTEQPDSTARRRVLGATLAGAALTPVLPSRWTKPVVDTVLLPAHAQTTSCSIVAGLLLAATTRTTTPSGAVTPVTSIATLTFAGCSCEPGAAVSITVDPEVSGASVGSFTGTSTADSIGSWTVEVAVPATAGADIANLTALPFSGTASGDAAAALPDAIAGTIAAPTCVP